MNNNFGKLKNYLYICHMKKIVYILLLFVCIPSILFARKKSEKNITEYNHDVKYKSYIDTLNSWDFKKELLPLKSDSIINLEFETLNKYRKYLGLPELKYDSTLYLVAKIQSLYCSIVLNHKLSHINYTSDILTDYIKRGYFVRNILNRKNDNINSVYARSEIITTDWDNIMTFRASPPHHLEILNSKYTHVGIYINKEARNMVVVFGVDSNNENDISKYPKFDLNSDIVKNKYHVFEMKDGKNIYQEIEIGGKKYVVDNRKPILVFRENGSAFYLYPPYKTNEKIHIQ
jgi:uncharacterized protein YkwD